jgi:MFS family permease
MTATGRSLATPERLVAVVCLAQVFVQIGASFWPALLPGMVGLWGLSWSQAGWITAIFFGAYMVSVPVLVTATDRFDPRQIYLLGVGLTVIGHLLFGLFAEGFWSALGARALTGIGWAGTYMTGLNSLPIRSMQSSCRGRPQATRRAWASPARCRLPAQTCFPAFWAGAARSLRRPAAPRSPGFWS